MASEYLCYYYNYNGEAMQGSAPPRPRGGFLLRQQSNFFRRAANQPAPALEL
jgi:hypothetical protein